MPQDSRVAATASVTRGGLDERVFGDLVASGVPGNTHRLPPTGAAGASPARLPDTGTATWVGGAGGFFRYWYGSDWTDVEAPVEVEEFTGTIAITADFADQTVQGCIRLCRRPGA